MSKQDELLRMISENESIKRYRVIEEIINKDVNLKKQIAQLKGIQQQMVNAKALDKIKAYELFKSQYDALYEEIESFPLVSEYLALQSEINQMIQYLVHVIEDGLNDEFEKMASFE